MPGPTITVRGEGGAVSELDVPDEGTVQRELFDAHLAAGRYVVLSGDWPPAEPATVIEEPLVPPAMQLDADYGAALVEFMAQEPLTPEPSPAPVPEPKPRTRKSKES